MIVGDVITVDGVLGVVRRLDKQARLVLVQRGDLSTAELEDDLDEFEPQRCKVLHNPSRDWPFVKVPDNKRLGNFTGLDIAGGRSLTLFLDWLPTEFGKTGCIFMNPAIGLGPGDILLVRFDRGVMRVNVPRQLVPVSQKMAKRPATAPATPTPEPVLAYSGLRRGGSRGSS